MFGIAGRQSINGFMKTAESVRLLKAAGKIVSGRHSSSRVLREFSEGLSAVKVPLENMMKTAEPDFLDLGRILQSVYTEAKALEEECIKAADAMGGDSEESAVIGVKKLVEYSLKKLRGYEEEIRNDLDRIVELRGDLNRLATACNSIEKTAMALSVVGLNISVESSRSVLSREMFGVISEQVKKLYGEVMGILEDIRRDSDSAGEELARLHQEVFQGAEELKSLSVKAGKTTETSFRDIEQLTTLSANAVDKARAHSKKIVRQIDEIVVGIQLHDNLSQRFEHISKALSDLEIRWREKNSDGAGRKEIKTRLGACFSTVGLQCAQINEAVHDISEAYEQNRASFREMGAEVRCLGENLSSTGTGRVSGDMVSGESLFENLKEALLSLNRLIGDGEEMVRKIREAGKKASKTVSQLTGHLKRVRGISLQTHLKALNAIINAAHLGDEGRTLEILAHEIKTLSDKTHEFAFPVEEILESTRDCTAKLGRTGVESNEESLDAAGDESIQTGIHEISEAYNQFNRASEEALNKSRTLQERIADTNKGLEFLTVMAKDLANYRAELEELQKIVQPYAGFDEEGFLPNDAEKISKRYTMKREREIHDQVMRRASSAGILNPEQKNEETNLELFDPLPEQIAANPVSLPEEETEGGDLGENVELF